MIILFSLRPILYPGQSQQTPVKKNHSQLLKIWQKKCLLNVCQFFFFLPIGYSPLPYFLKLTLSRDMKKNSCMSKSFTIIFRVQRSSCSYINSGHCKSPRNKAGTVCERNKNILINEILIRFVKVGRRHFFKVHRVACVL